MFGNVAIGFNSNSKITDSDNEYMRISRGTHKLGL